MAAASSPALPLIKHPPFYSEASGLITSKTGCVPEEEEEGGFFTSRLSFCLRSRGNIDALGWFESWDPPLLLLPLRKTLSMAGEPPRYSSKVSAFFPEKKTDLFQ